MSIEFQPVDPSIALDDLTTARLDGNGVFDTLMRAFKTHLDEQWGQNRIRGAEYAQVYLGGVQQILQTAMAFTMGQQEQNLKNQLASEQIALAKLQQAQVQAQTALVQQQKANLVDELQTATKQRAILDDNLLTAAKGRDKIDQDILNEKEQLKLITAQTAQSGSQKALLDQQKANLVDELQTALKNRASLDAQIALYNQKVVTERAQTQDGVTGGDSVVGKQKALYAAQTAGFQRDAEQKAAQILVDTWKVRRTTDEGTVADGVNALSDDVIGKTVLNMLRNVNVPV